MAVDSPARIAVVGAGPIGLEAALYARYLGYTVDLYERGRTVEHLLRQGHVTWFTPWDMNVSPLGAAALQAQDENWKPARADERLTCRELAERYFLPLAQSDLLIDGLLEQTEVVGIGREGLLRADFAGDERRTDVPFRLLLREVDGAERVEHADVVLDCSGTLGTPNYCGNGGLPALGELACRKRIEYEISDAAGANRDRYLGRRTLVVGAGHAAATSVTVLAALFAANPQTQITWATRREAEGNEPIVTIADDPFPARAALADQANLLAAASSGPVEHLPQTHVEAVSFDEATQTFAVELGGRGGGHRTFDCVVANVGHRADASLFCELQAGDVPDDAEPGTPLSFVEPDFYVLGAKTFGRAPGFNLAIGREQIRVLFTILGDREGLNLYATY
jgi:thioredoxin reductase